MVAEIPQVFAAQSLIVLLEQLAGVVVGLSDSKYSQKPVGVVESSVGGHVRHCLDHVRALIDAIETGALNYDDRRRGTAIESSPQAACALVEALIAQISELSQDDLDRPIHLTATISPDQPPICVESSVGRELVYVIAHTIHHNALVAAMVKTLGGWLPERFGYAPSTIKHMDQVCAR